MIVGISLMLFYMLKFKFDLFGGGTADDYWFGISPEGFGSVAMIVNFIISIVVSKVTAAPPEEVQEIVCYKVPLPVWVQRKDKEVNSPEDAAKNLTMEFYRRIRVSQNWRP